MKTSTLRSLLAAVVLLVATGRVLAEDIDIFSGGEANGVAPSG